MMHSKSRVDVDCCNPEQIRLLLNIFNNKFNPKDIKRVIMSINLRNKTIDHYLNDKLINVYEEAVFQNKQYHLTVSVSSDIWMKIEQFDIKQNVKH